MTTPNFTKIERVDLRKAWPNEAQDFTPWLAENITELGEALGMDLELQETEAAVGGYSLDVLATDLNQNRPVIIENQLEATNHDHLGKLLTYAAGYDANVIVWLTREFRDEHRQALDWLNRRTNEDTQFFGVVVELWQIGNSPLAPHFTLVVSPNEYAKSRPATLKGTVLDAQGKFRQSLREACDARGINYRGKIGGNSSYLIFEHPVKYVRYAAIWHGGRPGVEAFIEKGGAEGRIWNQKAFNHLNQRKTEIDSALMESEHDAYLVWEPGENRRHSRVAIYRQGNVLEETDSWSEFQDWMIRKLYKFRDVLTPRLKEFSEQEQLTSD